MIIVTGTKRSGTSMWMQVLEGAGFPVIGTPFPGQWKDTIRAANPEGFYESMLRSGIYFATNPHPNTGRYLFAEQVTEHAVKIFIPGLVRTERAFIGKVVASMRHWREYEASVERLYALEKEAFEKRGREHLRGKMTPALEWWWENHSLVRDVATRRYAIHLQSYDGLLADPEKVIAETMRWIGKGNAAKAAERVKPANRNFVRPESTSVEPEIAQVFDELYDLVHARKGLSPAFIAKMDEVHQRLWPRISAELRQLQALRRETRAERRAHRAKERAAGEAAESVSEPNEANQPGAIAELALEGALLDLEVELDEDGDS